MSRPVFRFAPSPNGLLHLGHAYSALLNASLARRLNGRLLLRIEDIDTGRTREEFVAAIFEDLAWLRLDWVVPVRRQSKEMADYALAADRLRKAGCLYPCFCSRGDIARDAAERAAREGREIERDPDGAPLYPGTCRGMSEEDVAARLAAGRTPAQRLDIRKATSIAAKPLVWTGFTPAFEMFEIPAAPEVWGDPVLVRRDTPTSYHLSVVVDDALQGVTHVVRGRDLEAATDLHRLLQVLLGLPGPHYHHHDLLRDATGAKLAKSVGSLPLRELRATGETAESIRERLGFERR